MREVNKLVESGDEKAKLVREAFIYNLSKNIGAMAAVLCGKLTRLSLPVVSHTMNG